ncbi:MAG: Gfo/Idh/MocA family protein [Janthinobacterium lividum]
MRSPENIGWGFVGTGGIARTVAAALDLAPGGRLVAVGSRDAARAHEFAAEHGAQAGYGGADSGVAQLLADPGVDAIYVATTHPQHHASAKAALLAGKPVLVEKPLTVTAAATRDLAQTSRARSVFLMEAYWTRFLPGTAALLDVIGSGVIGEVLGVHADLGFPAQALARFHDPEIGGGSLLDLGPYPVGLALTLLGAPQAVSAVGRLTATGVDRQIAMALGWDSGAVAALSTTMEAHASARAWIEGTRGRIEIGRPFHAVPEFTVSLPDDEGGETVQRHDHAVSQGHRFMLEHVHACLAGGLSQSPVLPLQWSLDVADVFEAVLTQVGVTRNVERLSPEH